MTEVVVVESVERVIEVDQVLDTLVLVELEQINQTEIELQALLAIEIELIETQATLLEVLDVGGEQIVLEVAQQGPPGRDGNEGDAPPIAPTFTYAGGKLIAVAYADGSTKAMAYTGDLLTSLDFLRTGYDGVRKTFSYNPDGTLAAVAQNAI